MIASHEIFIYGRGTHGSVDSSVPAILYFIMTQVHDFSLINLIDTAIFLLNLSLDCEIEQKIEEIKEMWQKLKESFTWRYKPIVRVRSFHSKF